MNEKIKTTFQTALGIVSSYGVSVVILIVGL